MSADDTISDPRVRALLQEGYSKVLEAFGLMGYPVEQDDNFAETAARQEFLDLVTAPPLNLI